MGCIIGLTCRLVRAHRGSWLGWCVGSEQFRQDLLLQMTSLAGSKFTGPEWRETAEKKAERIVAEELNREAGTRNNWTNVQRPTRRSSELPSAYAPKPLPPGSG